MVSLSLLLLKSKTVREWLKFPKHRGTVLYIRHLPWKNLYILHLSSNLLQGPLPVPPLGTYFFLVSRNTLIGNIPSLICNITSLNVLDCLIITWVTRFLRVWETLVILSRSWIWEVTNLMAPFQQLLQRKTTWEVLTSMTINWKGHCQDRWSIAEGWKF